MTDTRVLFACIWATALMVAGGCGSASTPVQDNAAPVPPQPHTIKTLPPSSHVTGLPYPPHCVIENSNGHALPDVSCTPGAVTSGVTQANMRSTICKTGWTATVRAPESETGPVKKTAITTYGETALSSTAIELDHLVPLELGGSNDVSNLWPEPSDLPGQGFRNTKDNVENDMRKAVCAGKVSLNAAQTAISNNWGTAEATVGIGGH